MNLFSEAFKKLEEATGISDVDGLVNIFVEAEKHNYSLFSHVNELTNDILKLDEQILEMKNEIQKYKNFGIKTVAQKEKILNDLEEKLNFTELRSDIYEKRYEKTMKIIMIFKIGIHQLLEKIGASEMLTEEGVNEGNLMHYLGLIELRTNEILQMFKYCQNSAVESPDGSALVTEDKKPLKVSMPTITEKETDEDENSVVLQRQDFEERAQVKMQDVKK